MPLPGPYCWKEAWRWGIRICHLTCDVYMASVQVQEAEAEAGSLHENLIQAGCKGTAPHT